MTEKHYTEKQLKDIRDKYLEFKNDCKKEKVKDTSQEEIEKGNHTTYPLELITGEIVKNKNEFIRSDYWQKIKFNYIMFMDKEFKHSRTSNKMKCQLCGESYIHEQLQLHHLTYKNFGNENPSELIRICFKCHCKIHKQEEITKKQYTSQKKFNKKNLFTLNDLILIGKYKSENLTLKNIIDKDKKYVEWLIKNNVIKINEKVKEYLSNI